MRSAPLRILGLASAAAALLALTMLSPPGDLRAEETTVLHVDLKTDGNTATSLGNSDNCISIGMGDTFTIDLTVEDVTTLSAWEVYFVYDRSIIEIVDRELRMFLVAEEGSRPLNASESLPDRDNLFRVAEADLSTPPKAESGSGVLARLTLLAKSKGRTFAGVPSLDLNDDGDLDFGPRLFAPGGRLIADADGDGLFDEPSPPTQIAVALPCDEALQPPPPDFGPPNVDGEDNSPVSFPGILAELDGRAGDNGGSEAARGSGSAADHDGSQGGGHADSGSDQGGSDGDETLSGDQVAGSSTRSSSDEWSPWIVGGISFAAVLFIAMAFAFVRVARARTF